MSAAHSITFPVIHYPECNARCDGDSHYLYPDPDIDTRYSGTNSVADFYARLDVLTDPDPEC